MENAIQTCNYFVDEAGDPNVFGKNGKVLIGTNGCSKYFILGLLQVDDPNTLGYELTELRKQLTADPYFSGVPSMQPENHKTFETFHAKDDLPEVRKEVFSIIARRNDLRFYAVVRDKNSLITYIRQRNSAEKSYRYNQNELYDYLIRRLFRDRLHKQDNYKIHFARRGSSDRTEALINALTTAKINFAEKFHRSVSESEFEVVPAYPKDYLALQAVDYFLWALQRLYEKDEERYLSYLWPSVRLIVDMDDTRNKSYGEYYNSTNILTLTKIKGRKPDS